jgi:hypothetical protein
LVSQHPFYDSREEFEASAKSYFSDPPQPKQYKEKLAKVKFSRRSEQIQKGGYDVAVYDMPTIASAN